MHGALVRDLLQARVLFFGERRAFDADGAFDAMNEAVGFSFALSAVFGVDALLTEAHFDAFKRPTFAPRVERERH